MSIDRVEDVANAQQGLVTRRQALATGSSAAAIRHALETHRWQRLLPGIYATFSGPVQQTHRTVAALLHAGPDALVTGALACALYGLRYAPESEHVDLLVPYSVRARSTRFVTIHRTSRGLPNTRHLRHDDATPPGADTGRPHGERDPLVWLRSPDLVPAAPVARAVLDTVCARDEGWWSGRADDPHNRHRSPGGRMLRMELLRDTRALLCEAVQRRLCVPGQLHVELDERDTHGTSHARRSLDDIAAGCRSAPECELRDLVRRSRVLPEPRWNQPLPNHRRLVPDACWPEAGLVVEVDSRSWHGFGDAPERTERRRALLAGLGWRVLPIAPVRIRREPEAVLTEIEAGYDAGVRT